MFFHTKIYIERRTTEKSCRQNEQCLIPVWFISLSKRQGIQLKILPQLPHFSLNIMPQISVHLNVSGLRSIFEVGGLKQKLSFGFNC